MHSSKVESGLQLFRRLTQRPNLEKVNPKLIPSGPYPNEFIEITGQPGTGKSMVLKDFIVRTLLPENFSGRNCGVILINTAHKFDFFDFMVTIEQHLKPLNMEMREVRKVISACLKNLTLLNCYDGEHLQMTLYSLERILMDNPNISLVCIDDVPAHYWQYRRLTKNRVSIYGYTKHMLKTLEHCLQDCDVVVAYIRKAETNAREIIMQEVTYQIVLKREEDALYACTKNAKVQYTLGKKEDHKKPNWKSSLVLDSETETADTTKINWKPGVDFVFIFYSKNFKM